MGKVDKEEIAQWLQGMMALVQEYDWTVDRFIESQEKGTVSF